MMETTSEATESQAYKPGGRVFRAYLGLGANLGTPEKQLAAAVQALARRKDLRVTAASSLYRTLPVGVEAQPEFVNAVIGVDTSLTPFSLLRLGKRLEVQAGRVGVRNAPRELDVDLLLYEGQILAEAELVVPHPRLAERAFALIPLAEIAPEVRHPLLDQTMAELVEKVSPHGVWQLAGGSRWANI